MEEDAPATGSGDHLRVRGMVGAVGPVPRARRVLGADAGGDHGRVARSGTDGAGGNREPAKVTNCYWQSYPKGSVSLWADVSPNEPKGLALKQLLDNGRKARAVTGLGDDAVFMENTGGNPGGTVFVRVGHWRVVIYRDADHPNATSESVLPALTSLARTAIPKLRKAG